MSDIFKNIIDYADLHSGFMTLVTAILVPTSIAITRYGLRIVFIIMMPVFWIKENSGYFLISFKTYKKIRIATFGNAFDYLPFAVAKRNGYFQKSFFGYRIGYDKYECLEDIEEKIKLDEVNIIFLAAAPAIRLFMSGYPIRIFGITCLHTQYLISNSRAIRKRNDLIIKPKIVVPEFSSSHFGLIGIIRSVGLTKNDFEIEFCEAK